MLEGRQVADDHVQHDQRRRHHRAGRPDRRPGPGMKEREVLVRMLAEAIRPTRQPMGRRARGMTRIE
ncbi:hypothetical protein EMIT051CA3_20953 [Pseudomonas chlororaphis]